MKGCFLERPTVPKYACIWDVKIVLSYLESAETVSLLQLSRKLCMLYLLVSAQRCQTLHMLKITDLTFGLNNDYVVINTTSILKTTKPGNILKPMKITKYHNCSVCFVGTLQDYLTRTAVLRNGEMLIISTQKPHKGVSRSTISRWIKTVMVNAGLEEQYGPHSTRSASTSKAKSCGVDLNTIIKTAGWTNAKTFATFYDKNITPSKTVQEAVMSNVS